MSFNGAKHTMKVAIIDSGVDLYKLYKGERHGYDAVWVPVELLTFSAIGSCKLLIIPAGSDNLLLYSKKECFQQYLRRGGWIFCFDGSADGVFDGLRWEHTTTNYKTQAFHTPDNEFAYLLNDVPLDGLVCKDGIRGWWCEGELLCDSQIPLIIDDRNRVIASLLPSRNGSGVLVATAAGRLPLFSPDTSLASNIFFSNLLKYCRDFTLTHPTYLLETNVYVHSGNWAHRSFLASEKFGKNFLGVHWSCLDEAILSSCTSIWIPWESNTRALKDRWKVLENAVNQGATLIIEDLRDNWIPGVNWQSRPVDSSWWKENRQLELIITQQASVFFPNISPRAYCWHYHGVFNGPMDAVPLIKTMDGQNILSLCRPTETRRGSILISTLDATFEFGVGKIKETAEYINGVLDYVAKEKRADSV